MGASQLIKTEEKRKFLSTIIGKPFELSVATLINNIKNFNAENIDRSFVKCYGILEGERIEPQPVPKAILYPLLENISLEDDQLMSEMWDNLLISAVKGNKDRKCIVILEQLGSLEANILDILFEWYKVTNNQAGYFLTGREIIDKLKLRDYKESDNQVKESLIYLLHIKLCQKINSSTGYSEEGTFQEKDKFKPTLISLIFMQTVSRTKR